MLLNCSFEDDQVIFHGIMFWIWLIHISCVCPVSQLCPTFCDPIDCSSLGSSVHGTLQERILEWVAISFYRRTSQPRNQTQVSCITGRFFTICACSFLSRKIKVILQFNRFTGLLRFPVFLVSVLVSCNFHLRLLTLLR